MIMIKEKVYKYFLIFYYSGEMVDVRKYDGKLFVEVVVFVIWIDG